jgi:hypothetical protein
VDVGVGVLVEVGVGVLVDVGVGVLVGVWVGVDVLVGVGVMVGPKICPGPQAEIEKLKRINNAISFLMDAFFCG